MSFAKALVFMMVAMFLAALLLGGCAYSGYRKVIGMDETVDASWAQVENVMQRRFDLIPNLEATVKGIAGHESEVFTNLAEARKGYAAAGSVGEKAASAGMFENAFRADLRVIYENYPQLRSNESFLKLQDSLEGTENRLAVERKKYNDAVRAMNAYIRAVPGSWYAAWAGAEKGEYFEVADEAREAPKVNFKE